MNDLSGSCQAYYQSVFTKYLIKLSHAESIDECLHDFLDQRPSGKYSARNRAEGLAAVDFWWEPSSLDGSQVASLALARIFHFDDAIATDLIDHLAINHADVLRWAIRNSKLFMRIDSPLWLHIKKAHNATPEWQEFFSVCDLLKQQLVPFEQAIEAMEYQLKSLSIVELLSYISVVAFYKLDAKDGEPANRYWPAYERIITRKLGACSEKDLQLSQHALAHSIKTHLMPMLLPQQGSAAYALENLKNLDMLVINMREYIDYEGSIDWFSYDSECGYQFRPGLPVIFNKTDDGVQLWEQTGHKGQKLWNYWMHRGLEEFCQSGLADSQIGSADNHDANQLAVIQSLRNELYLKLVFGIDNSVRLQDGTEVLLRHILLASELTTVFFEQEFLQPYRQLLCETNNPLAALGKLAMDGFMQGENRLPLTWSEISDKVKRICSWTVNDKNPSGDAKAAKAILQFWTSDLRALSAQIKELPNKPKPHLYEQPYFKIGRFSFQFPWLTGQQNNLSAAANNLRRVGSRRPEVQSETARIEQRLATLLESRGFRCALNYQPELMSEYDAGEVDLIAHLSGVVLLIEVKSGFIRSTRNEIWLHRTNTLRRAARQIKRKQPAVALALQNDQQLRNRLGIAELASTLKLHTWIVDTSIEFDGVLIDGFRVVSREVLEVVLRDETRYLKPLDEEDHNPDDSLYPRGFIANDFLRIIESGEFWKDL
jgi:Holliday junction resolvase-like predicted endonuclease